jgi:hypothetical protein
MAQDQTTFNEAAYLAAYPDVANALGQPGVESAWDHYQNYGKNEGRQGFFVEPQSEAAKSKEGNERYFNEAAYLAANPDVAAAIGQPGVKSAYEHYINFGQNEGRQASFDVSETTARANELSNEIYDAYKSNENYDAQYKELQTLKDKDPAAYYAAQIKFLGQQVGWQIGQNTNERSAPAREQIQGLLPEAINAGINPNTLDTILNTSVNTANVENQQRIINEQQSGGGGFNLRETLLGIAPIALMAVGAPFLDAALAAGSAGAAAGSAGGAAGAAGAGSLEAYMLAAGLNPGTFSGAAFALPSALSVAPEVASALNTANATLPTIPGSVPYTPSAFGTLTPPLTGSGAVPGAMSTAIPGTGLTGALPAGVLVGDGTLGTTIGATYMASGPGQFATNILGNAIPASSIGIGGFAPASGLSIGIKDALNAARLGKGLLGGDAAQPQQQGAMQRPQSTMPQGQVDYSGILNLLQVPSPQRNMYSLLG